jgi:hypothetical protein
MAADGPQEDGAEAEGKQLKSLRLPRAFAAVLRDWGSITHALGMQQSSDVG